MAVCLFMAISLISGNITVPSFANLEQFEIKLTNILFFLLALFAWQTVFSKMNLYHSRRISRPSREVQDVLLATSIGATFILLAGKIFKIDSINIPVILFFWICCTAVTTGSRVALRFFLRWLRRTHGRNLRHVLIIGTNPRAIRFAEKILATPEFGYRLIGYVDNEWSGIDRFFENNNKLSCSLDNFRSFIRDTVVDEVIIALPLKSFYDQSSTIISTCEEQGIIVRYLSSIFDTELKHPIVNFSEEDSLIPISSESLLNHSSILKRSMDLLISSLLFIISIPIFLIVPVVIKLTSKGPIFFIQERVGLGKRKFQLYKFRTMYEDAEVKLNEIADLNEASGPVFKIKNDPRITPFGKYLRKTSIDELPQLINVLKGDMSIVGPRPLPVRDYNGFNEDWHRRRFSVRPGITCLWQVNGRSDIPFDKWMELDMEYIDRWSLWLDIKILFKTIPTVLKGSGAV